MHRDRAQHRKYRDRIEITRLLFHHREVDAAAVDARRRAGLQPALRQLQLLQPRRQRDRRRVAGAAGRIVIQANMDLAVEKSACSQHHRTAAEADADLGHRTDHPFAFQHQVIDRLLEQPQIGLAFEPRTDRLFI